MNKCKANVFKKVTHVIFDMDGVLLDTERLYTQATQNIVGKYNKTFTWDIKHQLMGLTGAESAKKIVQLLDIPLTPDEYYDLVKEQQELLFQHSELMPDTEIHYKNAISAIAKRFGKVYTSQIQSKLIGTPERASSRIAVEEMDLPMSVDEFQKEFRQRSHAHMLNTPLMPGVPQLLKHLHSHRIPMAVATSSSDASYELKVRPHLELFKLFDHIVCGGSDPEVKHGKPHPDIFLVCASRFPDPPTPEQCLVFEDAPNGVISAITAGMQVVMLPDENIPPELRKDAHVVISRLDEAPLECFGLPKLEK